MSLRIAFDCDGVIADLDSALKDIATRLFGETPRAHAESEGLETGVTLDEPAAPTERATTDPGPDSNPAEGPSPEEEPIATPWHLALTRRQQHDLWKTVRRTENFWESLGETEPGIVDRIAKIARERRWEVVFITERPSTAGEITQVQTQRWLVRHGYDLPAVYVIRGTRAKVADALSLDVVVDDRPENCLDVKLESRARAILVWNGDFATVPANARRLGIEPVPGVGACLDLLSATPATPGLLRRIKQFIGA
jgi:hypothetical protein